MYNCDKLAEVKGLYHVVIAAGLKSAHLVGNTVARGEVHDRRFAAVRAQPAHKLKAVHLRHHYVEHDNVVFRALAKLQRFKAVEAGVNTVSLVEYRLGYHPVKVLFVFNNKRSHISHPPVFSLFYLRLIILSMPSNPSLIIFSLFSHFSSVK